MTMTTMRFEDRLLRTINRRLFYLALTASAVIIGLSIAVTILALKRVPPYVVALDQGRIVGYAHIFTATDELAPMVIENQLRQFIYDSRVVSGNEAMEDHNIQAVYAIARGQAYKFLDSYYKASPENDPIKLGQRGDWRDVRIVRCMKEPEPDTYRIEWTETNHPHDGAVSTSNMAAIVQIAIGPPDATDELNPIGLYVVNIDLQEGK
jgi:type IV secretory pathway TrbF-like protein